MAHLLDGAYARLDDRRQHLTVLEAEIARLRKDQATPSSVNRRDRRLLAKVALHTDLTMLARLSQALARARVVRLAA